MKTLNFILLILLVGACGQKSKVDPLFKTKPFNELIGDGEYSTFTIKMPLSESSIEPYDSPVDPNSRLARFPIIGETLRRLSQSIFNLGTRLGMGRQRITINQPIPNLESPYLSSIVIKRVFFHIEGSETAREPRARNWWERTLRRLRGQIRGDTELDFSFIKELSVNLRMENLGYEPNSYVPEVITEAVGDRNRRSSTARMTGDRLELLHYKHNIRRQVLRNHERGPMFVMYTEKPVDVRAFIRRTPELNDLIEQVVVVNKSLVVELKGTQRESEAFFEILGTHEALMEQAGVSKIDPCNEDICMDVKINEQNMMPMLLQGNRLRIETNADFSRVPPRSFQLKGFIEFEIKLDLDQ